MRNPLVLKLEQRDRLSDEEKAVLEGLPATLQTVDGREDIVREGDRPEVSRLLLEGFAVRYKLVSTGERQITAIHVRGDFVDLQSLLLRKMDHSVASLSPCKLALIPHQALQEVTERFPHLTRMLWLNTLIDGAIHREWLVAMGRRSAVGHTAHILCELYLRLKVVDATDGNAFQLPITQQELSDTLGLSAVHVNRVLQELRNDGLITWRGSTVTIEDWSGLSSLADFDPTYLNLQQDPR